jgi:hypothetical protein
MKEADRNETKPLGLSYLRRTIITIRLVILVCLTCVVQDLQDIKSQAAEQAAICGVHPVHSRLVLVFRLIWSDCPTLPENGMEFFPEDQTDYGGIKAHPIQGVASKSAVLQLAISGAPLETRRA